MINGVLKLCKDLNGEPAVVACVFSESVEPVSTNKLFLKKSTTRFQEHLKHTFSEELCVGVLVGDYAKRAIICTHNGHKDHFEQFANNYLFYDQSNSIERFFGSGGLEPLLEMKENPFLIILMESSNTVVITSYGPGDFEIRNLHDEGVYYIRDYCFQSAGSAGDDKYETMIDSWLLGESDSGFTAGLLTNELKDRMSCWPTVSGLGISLFKADNEGTLEVSKSEAFARDSNVPKPKGAVTGFNYYSMARREDVLHHSNGQLTNNELNRVLGVQWKGMTTAEKEPFLRLAEQDRRRYMQEMFALNLSTSLSSAASHNGLDLPVSSKPVTAYNLFVRQEKQFVYGLDIEDPQKKLGKHAGNRWASMEHREKVLYLIMHEVGAGKYGQIPDMVF